MKTFCDQYLVKKIYFLVLFRVDMEGEGGYVKTIISCGMLYVVRFISSISIFRNINQNVQKNIHEVLWHLYVSTNAYFS